MNLTAIKECALALRRIPRASLRYSTPEQRTAMFLSACGVNSFKEAADKFGMTLEVATAVFVPNELPEDVVTHLRTQHQMKIHNHAVPVGNKQGVRSSFRLHRQPSNAIFPMHVAEILDRIE